jgi:hypothetical protein
MAKNRIIYQSQSVYAGPSAPSGAYVHETGVVSTTSRAKPAPLQRVQNVNYSFDIARTDVNQFGQLANIDRIILDSPTVSMDFSYYLANFGNEKKLGFAIMNSSTYTSCISGMLNRTTDERNYYIRVAAEGQDSVGDLTTGAATNDVVGVGNGFLSSYSSDASVGDFPTASISIEGLNIAFDKGMTGNNIPQVNPTDGSKNTTKEYALDTATSNVGAGDYSVIRPGDIDLTIANGGLGGDKDDIKIQSYSLSFDLAREPLQKLGSKFAFAREMTFPVTVSLSVDALLGDLDTGNLADVVSNDASLADIWIALNSGDTAHIRYMLRQAKLDGHSYSTSIGDNKTVTMNFSSQIGSSQQTGVGLFMSGVGHDY